MNTIYLVFAVPCYAISGLLFHLHKKWQATAVKTAGTVTSVRQGLRKDQVNEGLMETVYFPTVKYEAEGSVFEHVFGESDASSRPFTIGQQVDIYFQPGTPDKPQLGNVSMKSAFAWILAVLGTVFLVMSFFMR